MQKFELRNTGETTFYVADMNRNGELIGWASTYESAMELVEDYTDINEIEDYEIYEL